MAHIPWSEWAKGAGFVRVDSSFSVPGGTYEKVEGKLRRGDYVVWCPSGSAAEILKARGVLRPGWCKEGTEPVVKLVWAVEGDRVDITPEGVFVEGKLQPGSQPKPYDGFGRALVAARWSGPIPEKAVLLGSDADYGFDGRYLYPQRLDSVMYRAVRRGVGSQ